MMRVTSLIAILAMSMLSTAHPGQTDLEKRKEAEARRSYLATLENTDLAHCAKSLTKRGLVDATMARRKETLLRLRKEAGFDHEQLEKRQATQATQWGFKDVLAKNHRSNLNLASSWQTADWTLLGQNQTTILHPETTEGPYYVSGEKIRKDVREGQKGLDIHLDLQVVDIKTCQPIPNSAVEIWAANATGVYGGVSGMMMGPMANGVGDQAAQTANVQNQALRGIQITNKEGAVQFITILPGYYTGRTAHIHVMTHRNQTVLANNTISGGTVNHVGQIFFDQSLIDEMHTKPPYKDNKNFKTFNKNDMIMAAGTERMADNVVNYVLIGPKLEDGIFAWLNFGIDASNDISVRAATECKEAGCAVKPFDILAEIGNFLGGGKGKDGKGKNSPPPMPKIPPGGIPGFEAPEGGFFGPGGFGGPPPKGGPGGPPPKGGLPDFLGSLFGGAKGKDGSSQTPGLLTPDGIADLFGAFMGKGGPPKGPPPQPKPAKREEHPAILSS